MAAGCISPQQKQEPFLWVTWLFISWFIKRIKQRWWNVFWKYLSRHCKGGRMMFLPGLKGHLKAFWLCECSPFSPATTIRHHLCFTVGGSNLNHNLCLHRLPPTSICLWLVDSKSVRAFLCVDLEAFIPGERSVKTLHSHFWLTDLTTLRQDQQQNTPVV